MVTVAREVVTTETAVFSRDDIENLIRERLISLKGQEWAKASISLYEYTLPVVMGQIDDRYTIEAKCVLTKKE